jgi:hypothetical protein
MIKALCGTLVCALFHRHCWVTESYEHYRQRRCARCWRAWKERR